MKAERKVTLLENGARLIRYDWGGEAWRVYLVIPRQVLLEKVRALRAAGRRWNSIVLEELLPSVFWSECYHGPGGIFVECPHKHHSSRRAYTWTQKGGLDI